MNPPTQAHGVIIQWLKVFTKWRWNLPTEGQKSRARVQFGSTEPPVIFNISFSVLSAAHGECGIVKIINFEKDK
ncbi:MAG: hypothetical protein HQM08_03445 [Candidatus Riflebacteria bacterium]|nr:hypothetical protein [Candidatus Riflebacteria bacterium]